MSTAGPFCWTSYWQTRASRASPSSWRRPFGRLPPVNTRFFARVVGVATAALAPVLFAATPALAKLDDGEVKGKSLGAGLVILCCVILPLGIFAVIAFFSVLPSMLRRPRYRPGKAWGYDPLWFSGPDEPDRALSTARPGATARGGEGGGWWEQRAVQRRTGPRDQPGVRHRVQ